jgi:sortase (surface protein transpeptidase)
MARRWSLTLVVVGLVLLLGAPLAWLQAQPAATVGEVPEVSAAEIAEDEPVDQPVQRGAILTSSMDTDAIGAQTPEPAGVEPQRLSLPSLGVDAGVVPVGLEADGGMEVPADVTQVGWYSPGVQAGAAGTAVLAGHVDSRTQGPGALFDLRRMEPGDPVVVSGDGETTEWRVTGRTRYAKDELPLDEIFRWDGEPRLVLITCGGDFVAEDGHYRDNVVVYAEPA